MVINQQVKYNAPVDPLSAIFFALADPTRRAILDILSRGDATVSELASPFAMSLPAISKHIKVLERAALITRGKNAQWRPCSIQANQLREVAGWAEKYRNLWEGSFDNLAGYLEEIKKQEAGNHAANNR